MENTNKPIRFLYAILVAGCILSMGAPVFAEDCRDTAFTQTDMNLCAISIANEIKQELEDVYEKLMKRIAPAEQVKLSEARKAWLEYRIKQCDFDTFGTRKGSIHPMLISDCIGQMDMMQKEFLQQQLECEKGDLACGLR